MIIIDHQAIGIGISIIAKIKTEIRAPFIRYIRVSRVAVFLGKLKESRSLAANLGRNEINVNFVEITAFIFFLFEFFDQCRVHRMQSAFFPIF